MPIRRWNELGVAELVAIIDIGRAMVVEVPSGAFYTVVKAPAHGIAKLLRCLIPTVVIAIMIVIVALLWWRGTRLIILR